MPPTTDVSTSSTASTTSPSSPPSTPPPPLKHRLHYPYSPTTLRFHPALSTSLSQYGSRKEIMHTLFYGPPSSGKLTLARQLIAQHTQLPLSSVERLHRHTYQLRDKEFPFYKTPVHFEMSVADFVPNHQKALIELLQELSKTLNVSRNTYKIILLREADLLSRPIQHQLRRMMEVFYTTCRLVFISHSLDRLDQTLQSRFVCVRVPRPRPEMMEWAESTTPTTTPTTPNNPTTPQTPQTPPLTIDQWLNHQSSTMGPMYHQTIADHTVDQLWRALLRKTIPLPTFRKWIRLMTMTQLSPDDIVYRLLLKRITKTPAEATSYNAVVNYYLHQYERLKHANHGEIQLETLLCALHTSLHGSKEAFERVVERVTRDIV